MKVMRRLLVIVLFWSAGSVHATEWFSDLDAGIAQARKLSRPIFVDFMAPWCGYCRRMRTDVFSTPDFKNQAASFVLVRVNVDESLDGRRFRVEGLPTMVLLDRNGYLLGRLDGYTELAPLLRVMREALTKSSIEDRLVREARERPGVESSYRAGLYYAKVNDQTRARTYFLAAWNAGKYTDDQGALDSLYNAAVSSMELKDYPVAVQLWSEFLKVHKKRDQDLAYARYFRGLSLRSLGRHQEARDDIAYAAANLPAGEDRQAAVRMNTAK